MVPRLALLNDTRDVSAPRILMLAGESSGDMWGGSVATALRRRIPGAGLSGLGGPAMERAGVRLMAGLDDLAVMGFGEVCRHLPRFFRIERAVRGLVRRGEADLVIAIDYPGLNLRICREARKRGIPVVYYVAPQVWAWKPHRVRALRAAADRVAVILPWETEPLEAAGVPAAFVGHPVLDAPSHDEGSEAFRSRWGLPGERPLLALLPGSRAQEVARHLPAFTGAAARLQRDHPELLPVVAKVPHLPDTHYGATPYPWVHDAPGLLRHARVALLKSGTSTLQAALHGTPCVTAYRTSALTWAIARRLVRVPHISLVNLLLAERVVPELLQAEVEPRRLAATLAPLIPPEAPARMLQLERLAEVRARLGTPGAAGRVAEMAVELLRSRAA